MGKEKSLLTLETDGWNEIYRSEGIKAEATENSPEVWEVIEDSEYEIEYGHYEKGVPYERLERL